MLELLHDLDLADGLNDTVLVLGEVLDELDGHCLPCGQALSLANHAKASFSKNGFQLIIIISHFFPNGWELKVRNLLIVLLREETEVARLGRSFTMLFQT